MKMNAVARAMRPGLVVLVSFMVLAAGDLAVGATPALAGAGWELIGRSYPTNFSPVAGVPPRVSGTIAVDVFNVGSSAAGCTEHQHARELEVEDLKVLLCPERGNETNPITVTDVLPAGVKATEAGELIEAVNGGTEPRIGHEFWTCTGNGPGGAPRIAGATVVTCTNKASKASEGERELGAFAGGGGAPTIGSNESVHTPQPAIGIAVDVQAGAEEHETNHVAIAGGGVPTSASTSDPVTISAEAPEFGPVDWDGWFSNADGTIDTQAGSHPYEATFSFDLATALDAENGSAVVSNGEVRTAEVELPRGFVGDPTAVPECPRAQFDAEQCPLDTMIGITTAYFANVQSVGVRVFNLVPPPGVPAEFGFSLQGLNTYLDASVRSGSDYGINEHISAIAHKEIIQAVTVLWGDPGDASHNRWRDGNPGGCAQSELEQSGNPCTTGLTSFDKPLLTLPTSCGGGLPFVLRTTSWTGETKERTFYSHDSSDNEVGLTGCEDLAFGPLLSNTPEMSTADSPTGLSVDVKPSLGGLQQVEGLGSADIQDATVTLPQGFVVNPGQASGLQACQPENDGVGVEGPPSCPVASRIGSARAKSPLLEGAAEKELEGSVYVLQSNPPDVKLLAALSGDGVSVKLVLNAELNEQTGQITTKVVNVPELPVSDFKLSLDGQAHAAVDTPTRCGTFETTGEFTPWTTPFGSKFNTGASLEISSGAGGSACPSGVLPFAPALTAGSSSDQAGGFTTLTTQLVRDDGQQRIDALSLKTPAGLSGMLSNVPLCPEPQAQLGECPGTSRIGHATVESGPGPNPLVIPQPGEPEPQIYLTGPYGGAPFGLSIVTRVIAGPFDLGTIVTRAKIEVDPHTAQITVTTDQLPQIIDGVPTDLRSIDAVIDRPEFIFNPTNCTASSFTGSATGASAPGTGEGGSSVPVVSRFHIGGCQALQFAPKFTVSTPAKTSKAAGAGLTTKLAYPIAAQGTQADIAKVKVDLPKQLPSQLKTLNQACLAAVFEANPAGCPPHSVVGHATVHTPVLPVPLTGPAYFVSHGNEKFPSLTIVLQGDGVTVDLVGDTFIKNGITSDTFAAVPDVPFSTFELTLPQGEYAALTSYLPASAKGSFCGQKLVMPTAFVAQNGLEIHQNTAISVTGCTKTLTNAQKLAAALRACKKKKKAKRASCEASAHKRYGAAKSKKANKSAKGSGR